MQLIFKFTGTQKPPIRFQVLSPLAPIAVDTIKKHK